MQNELNIAEKAVQEVYLFKQRHYEHGSDSTRHGKLVSKICGNISDNSTWLYGALDRYIRHGKVLSQDAYLFSEIHIMGFTEDLHDIEQEILSGKPEYLENPSLVNHARDMLKIGKDLLDIIKDQNIGQAMRDSIDEG